MLRSISIFFILLAISACVSFPVERKVSSFAIPQDTATLARVLREMGASDCGDECSGFSVLNRGEKALRWRLVLADSARKSIDVQYYIWHMDASGTLLLNRLIHAADRGVRVRILVDDTQIMDSRKSAAALNLHPNIEVRSFNPFASKTILGITRALEFIIRLDRLNHRMHNKLMVADNAVAIVGGRNIGDEYFGLHRETNLRDMDLISVGPIAADVSDSFYLYWNSEWAYTLDALNIRRPNKTELLKLMERIENTVNKNKLLLGSIELEARDWNDFISRQAKELVFSKGEVVFDDPRQRKDMKFTQAAERIAELINETNNELLIVSPYFVPTEKGVEKFSELISRGIKVKILTNSLASNDVVITNAGYKRYRKPLLQAGVKLYELRADAEDRKYYSAGHVVSKWLGLHAKVIVFDRTKVFVGTLNLDPRSVIQNTEIGLVIDNPELAEQIINVFKRDVEPTNSWRLELNEKEKIIWKSSAGSRRTQPAKNIRQKILDWILPAGLIEDQI